MTLRADDSRDLLESWHLTPSSNRDYHFLDGLRGLAILMVVFSHVIYFDVQRSHVERVLFHLFGGGANGVPLFFALSGFLISWPFWKRKHRKSPAIVPAGYAWRRFYKIYPPLVLSMLCLLPLYQWLWGGSIYIKTALEYALGVPLFFPVSEKFNPVMWSLIIEVQFYIILPWLMVGLKNVSMKACLWIFPTVFFLLGMGFRLLRALGYLPQPFTTSIYYVFPTDLDYFALGILIAGLYSQGKIGPRAAPWAWAGVVLFVVMGLYRAYITYHGYQGLWESEILGTQIACALLLLSIGNPAGFLPRLWANAVLRWFGIISYELYLIHQALANMVRYHFGPAGGSRIHYLLEVGGTLVVSLAWAVLVYRFFSLPILRYGRKKHAEA